MFNNKHVVVIGSTSGIGLEVARMAKLQGAALTLIARKKEKLEKIARDLGASCVVGDIGASDIKSWASQIPGHIDHIYIAAGTFSGGSFLDSDLDSFRTSIEERLWGPSKLIQYLAPTMNSTSSVTLTGGVSTLRPNQGSWITNISTAVADQMARSFAIELAPIRFNTVAPGFVLTPMWDFLTSTARDGYEENFKSKTPTKRLSTTEDVAKAVIALMQNPGINGQAIYVDGGYTI